MKEVSAILIGLVPAVLLCAFGMSEAYVSLFFLCSLTAAILSLLIYSLLQRWHHAAVLTFLALGLPLMFYVFVAAIYPIFLTLFYGAAGLVVLAGCLGALISGTWSWQSIGINIGYMFSVLLAIIGLGQWLDTLFIEAGVLAAAAFAITRLCDIDFVSGTLRALRRVKGPEKIL